MSTFLFIMFSNSGPFFTTTSTRLHILSKRFGFCGFSILGEGVFILFNYLVFIKLFSLTQFDIFQNKMPVQPRFSITQVYI